MTKFSLIFAFFLFGLALQSCDQPKQTAAYENQAAPDEPQRFSNKVYEGFQGEIYKLTSNYLQMKDAFVEDDTVGIRAGATALQRELVDTSVDSLAADQREKWLQTKEKMDQLAEAISTTDANIAQQREHFYELSQLLVEAVKTYHLPEGEKLYRQYCPMAFDNEGAYWLSDKEKIRNPYFGDQMLECGRVEETLQ